MRKKVSVVGNVSLNYPEGVVLSMLWDMRNIEKYEPKLTTAHISKETEKKGTYSVRGFFAGIPWSGKFSFEINDQGFSSRMIEGSLAGYVDGGFVVRPAGNQHCKLTHYENYHIPIWLSPISPFLRFYLNRAMKKELRQIQTLLEAAS